MDSIISARFVGGFDPPLVPLNPQVFIDPHKNSQKYIADSGFTTNRVRSIMAPKTEQNKTF